MKSHKECRKCRTTKPISEFTRDGDKADGFRTICRICDAQRRKASRDPERTPPIYTRRALAPAPTPLPPPSAEELIEAHAERRESSELKRQVDAVTRHNLELLKIIDAVKAIPDAEPRVIVTPKWEKKESVALMQASDWHVEEFVDSKKVRGLNAFDLAEAQKRAELFFANGLRLTDMAARDSLVRRLVLGLGGDFFSNGIHDELMETNQLGPTEAVRFVRDLLVSGIEYILANSDLELDVPCVVGNHGRITKKLRFSTAVENNLEYLLYHMVAAHFAKEERVRFHICPGTMQMLTLFDNYQIRTVHGYEVKSGGGVGGITIPIRKKLAAWDKSGVAHLTLIHHFHQKLDGGDFLVNGSLIGFNEYAQANGFSPEPPSQNWALISARHGGEKTLVAPIWVTE